MKPLTKEKVKALHFVRYQWDRQLQQIEMKYYDKEFLQAFNWTPDDFDMTVVGPRKCIGHFQDSYYYPCLRHSSVTDFPQCYKCVSYSIPILKCIFEPICWGDKCPDSICNQPHQVYLAFFNTIPKIGMTSEQRLKLRLYEQGADAFSIIATVPNRFSARALERNISVVLQMKESYDPEVILRTFTREIDKKVIEEKYSLIYTSIKDRFDLKCSKLHYVDVYPLDLPLRSMPILRPTLGLHNGKFVGIKGKFLIYESKGLNALRLNDMLGQYMVLNSS
ncbi:MAG: DUF2797 domain-containing protein [Thermoplasmata archaeon]|nr:MAG: DUF2797 domain-containing protein [Thermoplasmata archaeon]